MLVQKSCPRQLWQDRVHILVDRWEATAPPDGAAEQGILERFVIQEGLLAVAEGIMAKHDFKPADLDPWEIKQQLEKFTAFALVPETRRVIDYTQTDPSRLFLSGTQAGRMPVGIGRVDEALDGGLGPGELGILVAPSGGGKTAVLLQLACAAILAGKTVLHVTLEISTIKVAERVTMTLTGKTKEEIRAKPALVKRAMAKVKKAGGKLFIHDVSHEHVTMQRLEGIIARYPHLDLLLVDYADLMGVVARKEEHRISLGGLYKGLRRLSSAYTVPAWTASQANRAAMGLEEFGGEHVAEDISKIHTGDVVICIMQTSDEKARGILRLKVDKTRESAYNPIVTVKMDWSRMTWTDAVQAGGKDVDSQANQGRKGTRRRLDPPSTRSPRTKRR